MCYLHIMDKNLTKTSICKNKRKYRINNTSNGAKWRQHLKPVKTLLQVDKNRCALLELDERSGGVFGGAENRFCSRSCRWSPFLVGLPSRLGWPENLSPTPSNQLSGTFGANKFRKKTLQRPHLLLLGLLSSGWSLLQQLTLLWWTLRPVTFPLWRSCCTSVSNRTTASSQTPSKPHHHPPTFITKPTPAQTPFELSPFSRFSPPNLPINGL